MSAAPARLAYSLGEAAAACSVSRATINRLIVEKRLPAARLGSRVLIRACDLERLLASLTVQGVPLAARRRGKQMRSMVGKKKKAA